MRTLICLKAIMLSPKLPDMLNYFRISVLACVVALAGLVTPARADTINIFSLPGTEGLGSFTGTLTVNNFGTSSNVIFSITNTTTPATLGGVITGMAFNDPSGSLALIQSAVLNSVTVNSVNHTSSYNLFGGSSFNNTINGQPFGFFDVGAGTGVNFLGGNTLGGVGTADPGETVVFNFTLNWKTPYSPTASDFMNAYSVGGSDSAAMLVRFQGFSKGGSDKVPGSGGGTPEVIPAPPALLLAVIGTGCGLFGLSWRRRFRTNASPNVPS